MKFLRSPCVESVQVEQLSAEAVGPAQMPRLARRAKQAAVAWQRSILRSICFHQRRRTHRLLRPSTERERSSNWPWRIDWPLHWIAPSSARLRESSEDALCRLFRWTRCWLHDRMTNRLRLLARHVPALCGCRCSGNSSLIPSGIIAEWIVCRVLCVWYRYSRRLRHGLTRWYLFTRGGAECSICG